MILIVKIASSMKNQIKVLKYKLYQNKKNRKLRGAINIAWEGKTESFGRIPSALAMGICQYLLWNVDLTKKDKLSFY